MNDKTVLIAAGAVSGVVVLGAAVWAGICFSGASSRLSERDSAFRAANKLASSNPYPSQQNADVAEANLVKAEGWARELQGELGPDPFVGGAEGMSPGDFSRLREQTLVALAKDAPVGDDGAPIVQPGFSFGFGRYSGGTPAEDADVPRLVHQLKLVDHLVRALYATGISRIEGVGREVFEGGAEPSLQDDFSARVGGGGGGSSGGGGRRRRNRGSASSESSEGGAREVPAAVDIPLAPAPALDSVLPISRQRFVFVFQAKAAALSAALDAIDALEPYATVASLSFDKIGEDVKSPVAGPDAGDGEESGGGRRGRRADAEEAPAGIKARPAPRTSRLVSGPLLEAPVRVRMYVDVYSAEPAPSGENKEEEE